MYLFRSVQLLLEVRVFGLTPKVVQILQVRVKEWQPIKQSAVEDWQTGLHSSQSQLDGPRTADVCQVLHGRPGLPGKAFPCLLSTLHTFIAMPVTTPSDAMLTQHVNNTQSSWLPTDWSPVKNCSHLPRPILRLGFKGTPYKSCFGGFKTDITHGRVLGISVNIPTKVFCLM